MARFEEMHRCPGATCGYIYNPDKGDKKAKVPKGTRFEELPEGWCCPSCGAGKRHFQPCLPPKN